MSAQLVIGNLARTITHGILNALFCRAGEIQALRVVRDPASGVSSGYALVEYATQAEAGRAVRMFNGHTLASRPLIVAFSTGRDGRTKRRLSRRNLPVEART